MKKWFKIILFAIMLALFSLTVAADSLYQLSAARTYQITYQVEVKNHGGSALNFNLKVSNFMVENLPPYQKAVFFQVFPAGVKINKTKQEQIINYHVSRLGANQTLKLEFKYNFVNYAIKYELTPYRGFSDASPNYLQAETGIEVDHHLIKELAEKLTAKAETPLEKAKEIFRYVNQHLTYQEQKDTKTHSALKTLLERRGICEDYSLLYIALCRAVKIPARFVSGFRFEPEKIGVRPTDLSPYAHAWTEINLPGVGWISVDPTFAYTINGVKKVNYDYFGRITKQDRHLFTNYSRQKTSSTWEYSPKNPARIVTTTKILIREI